MLASVRSNATEFSVEESSEALVIGGGPVGLFAALCLSERGVSTRVVDAEWERPARSYACGLHPETLRLLDEVGLLEQLGTLAHRVDRLSVYRGFDPIASIDFNRLTGAFPHVLTLPQTDLEAMLTSALEQRGLEVLWRHEVTKLTLEDSHVRAAATPKRMTSTGTLRSRLEETAGDAVMLRAEAVVAADGYYSPCRTALAIDPISLEQTEAFAVFEFDANLSDFQHEGVLVLDASVSAFWPLGPTRGRWMFPVWERLDGCATPALLSSLIRARVPWFTPVIERVTSSSVTQFERLLASEFGRGRIWLAGDAAHVTSPIGFQSMNRGFSEAHQIAATLGEVLRGNGNPADALPRFNDAQQREWRRLLGIDIRVSGERPLSGSDGAKLVPCLPASGADLVALLAQVGLTFG